MKYFALLVLVLFFTLPFAPATAQDAAAARLAAQLETLDFDAFVDVSYDALLQRDPEQLVELGMMDSAPITLTDVSDAFIQETYTLYSVILERLQTFDRSALSTQQDRSYAIYEWFLEDKLRERAFLRHDFPVTFLITGVQNGTLNFFTEIHPIRDLEEAEDYIARLGLIDEKFEQLAEGLQIRRAAGIVPPRFVIDVTLGELRELAAAPPRSNPYFTAFAEKLGEIEDLSPAEHNDLLAAAEEAVAESVGPAYSALAAAVAGLGADAPQPVGAWQYPDGAAYYDYALQHHSGTDLTADQIHELGLRELDRIHAEMHVIFDQLGYPQDASIADLYARASRESGHVPSGQVVAAYEELLAAAAQNVGVAFETLPTADVIVIGVPFGGYYIGAALDGSRPGAFYASVSGQGQTRLGMPTLLYHETIPGHHLQVASAQEIELPLMRRNLFFTAYVEGWALYAERLAADLGWYDDDPFSDLGRLQGEAFRAARLVVDTGIHARRWTFEQAAEFFAANTGHDLEFARRQIARYVVWPGQATAYMVGMLQILDLRAQAQEALAERFDLAAFHRAVLGSGSMPPAILEQTVADYIAAASQAG